MQTKNKTRWYQNETGAIDLASIMVGIIVIGLIGGTIAATVFAVIPWAQDNAAKQQLGSIVQAENAYMGLSSTSPSSLPAGLASNSFASSADLETAGLLKAGTTYCASTANSGPKSYEGFSLSSSGALFTVSDKNTSPTPFSGTLPADCAFLGSSGSGSIPAVYVDPTPKSTVLKFRCDTAQTGMIPLNGALTGTETWDNGSTKVTRNYTNAVSGTSITLDAGVDYTMTFEGTYSSINLFDITSARPLATCLRSMDHWGSETGVTAASNAFYNASNLVSVPDHIPSTVKDASYMFYRALQFDDPNVSNWDTSNITNMYHMFDSASIFNQPIGSWNTSNVTTMQQMFYAARKFDQPINNWNTSNVTSMSQMFDGAYKFNRPLDKWDTSKVTRMYAMFQSAQVFNQNIKMWNVAKVTSYTSFRAGSALTAENSPFG